MAKAGRPKIAHDERLGEEIRSLRQHGATLEEVARIAGISLPTLRKLYAVELEAGVAMANIAVGRKLFERCMEGDTAALIFWCKTRMGWSEKRDDGVRLDVRNGGSLMVKLLGAYRNEEPEE